ncbi:MAG: type IV pilus modification protein PilV [Arenimonas sp.]
MKKSKMRALRQVHQTGTSLIEVLISVLILGIGLLGIASMQAITLRNGQSSMERSQAVMHTYSILDSMRANLIEARANNYNMTRTCAVPAVGTTLAQNDLNAWMTGLQGTIGVAACGTILCASNVCTITVEWNDSRGSGGSSAQTTITRSRI